jgi:hypothetical protein
MIFIGWDKREIALGMPPFLEHWVCHPDALWIVTKSTRRKQATSFENFLQSTDTLHFITWKQTYQSSMWTENVNFV